MLDGWEAFSAEGFSRISQDGAILVTRATQPWVSAGHAQHQNSDHPEPGTPKVPNIMVHVPLMFR